MEFLLYIKNGKYNLEKTDGKIIKRTNNQEKIDRIIKSIDLPVIRATFIGKDVKMYFGDNKYFTLKNYATNKDLELYSTVMDCISESTRINKVNSINKNKLLALTGITVLSLSIAGIVNAQKTNIPVSQNITVSQDIMYNTNIKDTFELENVAPSPTIEIKKQEIKSFEDRFAETLLLKNSEFQGIPLATKFDSFYCNNIIQYSDSELFQYMSKYGEQFGVDPYLILAVCYNESNLLHEKTIPGGSRYNGYGVGIGQHESPNGTNSVTAFNYETNQYETEIISMENACDLEMNIKMTVMLFQNKLNKYKNIYVAIQSYNYGDGVMDIILEKYAQENGVSVDYVLNNIECTKLLEYIEHFHFNPQEYLSNWNFSTYGDADYVKKVIGYYIGTESINRLPDGTLESTNLVTLEKIQSKRR